MNARAIAQAGDRQVAASPVGFTHALGDFIVGQYGGGGGFHHKPRQAVQHAQHQGFGVGHHGRLGNDPADAPAGHGVGFREAADHDAAVGHARQRGEAVVLTVEHQAFVDFVYHHPQFMLDRQVGNCLQLLGLSTTPVGLLGLEKKIARVRGVMAAASSAGSRRKPESAAHGTRTSVAPLALSVAS